MVDYVSILPEDVESSEEHRYLRLPHPRTGQPQLYLPYVSSGKEAILEVIRLNGSRRRTLFIDDSTIDSGAMLMHVPIDPLYLVIPLVFSLLSTSSTQPFQPLSDLFAQITSSSLFALTPPFTSDSGAGKGGWNEDVHRLLDMKSIRRVFKLCCEKKVVSATPGSPESSGGGSKPTSPTYYRPSLDAMIKLLRLKVEHFAAPPQWNSFDHLVRSLARDGLSESDRPDLIREARLKASIEHIAQYLPQGTATALQSSYNFSALQEYLSNRTAATLAAQAPPTMSTKKTAAGVKRKASATSRGVETLKKVNTSSMAKLTSFFKTKG